MKVLKSIDIHYSEIGLKGKNRSFFEKILIKNIKKQAEKLELKIKIEKNMNHLLIIDYKDERIIDVLKKVFGIRYFRVGFVAERNLDSIKKLIKEVFIPDFRNKTVKIETNRADKKYEIISPEMNKIIANFLKENNVKTDFKIFDEILHIDILKDVFFISKKRIEGLGGLPIGSSGKLLCLVSGGFDSAVATWLIMKRGCTPIIYTLACSENFDLKIINEIKYKLEEYSPEPITTISQNLKDFNKIVLKLEEKNLGNYNCLVFKHFLLKNAESIAKANNCLGIVTGDSIGQVASQTLENLYAQRKNIDIPIYSPLITYDKEEIINLAKKIGLYEICKEKKEDYFFLPKHPITRANLKKFQEILKMVDKDELDSKKH